MSFSLLLAGYGSHWEKMLTNFGGPAASSFLDLTYALLWFDRPSSSLLSFYALRTRESPQAILPLCVLE